MKSGCRRLGCSPPKCGSRSWPGLLGLAIALLPGLVAAEQDRASREAVESLEAYAVYKMARYDEALARFMALAEKGNVQGMLNVANMLSAGQGVEPDPIGAFAWYSRAASQGDPIGMYSTGRAYESGLGTRVDTAQAESWYRRAAAAGSTEAQLALGKLLQRQGATEEGMRWIRSAAEAGDIRARRYVSAGPITGTAVPALDRALILSAFAAVDRAARHRNTPGVVYYLARDALVRLRLSEDGSWTHTDRRGLQKLWQATFDRGGDYRFERTTPEISLFGGRIRVESRIVETVAGPNDTRVIEMLETVELDIVDDRVVMRALSLEIAA